MKKIVERKNRFKLLARHFRDFSEKANFFKDLTIIAVGEKIKLMENAVRLCWNDMSFLLFFFRISIR